MGILFGTRLMHLLVMNLSEFQHLKHKVFQAHERLMNTSDLISDILAIYNVENNMKNIQILHRHDQASSEFEEKEVIADSQRISQVLQNKIRKAINLAKTNSVIEI